ncbi:LysR family transcriptional regulator [Ferrimonas marina]|uniref:Transcriptional regulator, LysR family n=1 Tax=Ferrimonas marina TaxID=299255 RepID=A0A1M5MSE1_9GAMM|nr:LysR family transcriptional regulator [Ferrimonas marina]SHG80191.1 transcriptional regulator, LysR family [Ferrimonas marina]
MEIESIRLFVLAAERLNISAAGRQLGLAPAVASTRLSKLEAQIGVELLHRSTRKVSLSEEGQRFLPFAKEILAQQDAALASLGLDQPEISGTLRFAASSTFAQLYVAPILTGFLERYPAINVEMRLSDTPFNLIEEGIDLALRNVRIDDSNLRARKVADDTRILCASPAYLARHGTPLQPSDLMSHQMLVFQGGRARKLFRIGEEDSEASFPPVGAVKRVVCDDGASMRIATEAGVGIAMNAYWSVHQQLQSGALARVLPEYEVDSDTAIWLIYPKATLLHPKVRVFIDYLLEHIKVPSP